MLLSFAKIRYKLTDTFGNPLLEFCDQLFKRIEFLFSTEQFHKYMRKWNRSGGEKFTVTGNIYILTEVESVNSCKMFRYSGRGQIPDENVVIVVRNKVTPFNWELSSLVNEFLRIFTVYPEIELRFRQTDRCDSVEKQHSDVIYGVFSVFENAAECNHQLCGVFAKIRFFNVDLVVHFQQQTFDQLFCNG